MARPVYSTLVWHVYESSHIPGCRCHVWTCLRETCFPAEGGMPGMFLACLQGRVLTGGDYGLFSRVCKKRLYVKVFLCKSVCV